MLENTNNLDDDTLLELTSGIVTAYVGKHVVPVSDMRHLIADVHAALSSIAGTAVVDSSQKQEPAVSIAASRQPHHLVCLECGKQLKSLKRHLMAHHQSTPEQYRQKWSLPASYPMVTATYSATRSHLAKASGLGRAHRVTSGEAEE